MRGLLVTLLFIVPFFMLRGGEQPVLKSTITVERGVYKQDWEHDFFRDLLPAEQTEKITDAVADTTDEAVRPDRSSAESPDTDDMRRPRIVPRLRGNGAEKRHTEEPAVIAAPPEEERVKEPERAEPAPAEQLPPPPRRPEPKIVPDTPREPILPPEVTPPPPSVDTKKKQKDRTRELEKKRKKGNFRDPKITY